MRRYEAVWGPQPEPPQCGRPAGHGGPCRSPQALQRAEDAARGRPRGKVNVWLRVAPSLKARLAAYAGGRGLSMCEAAALLLDEALSGAGERSRAA